MDEKERLEALEEKMAERVKAQESRRLPKRFVVLEQECVIRNDQSRPFCSVDPLER
jgi:hypothetical protein